MKSSIVLLIFLTLSHIAIGTNCTATGKISEPEILVEMAGISVLKPPSDNFGQFSIYSLNAGTSVYLKVLKNDAKCYSIDPVASKLHLFEDDKGTKLCESGFGVYDPYKSWIGHSPRETKEGDSCIFAIRSTKLCEKRAKKMRLKADVSMIWGSDEKMVTQEISLKEGEIFYIDQMPIALRDINKNNKPNKSSIISFWFTSKSPLKRITDWKFLDPNGHEIKGVKFHQASISGENDFSYSCSLPIADESIKIQTTYYNKVEKLMVPIDIVMDVPNVEPDHWMSDDVPVEVVGYGINLPYKKVQAHFSSIRNDATFISGESEACILKAFTDDKGTVLIPPGQGRKGFGSWIEYTNNLYNKNGCYFIISSGMMPAKNAERLYLKANVVQVWGKGEKQVKEIVELKSSTQFQLGSLQVGIEEILENSDGKTYEIYLTSDKTFEQIKKLEVTTETGTIIKDKESILLSYKTQQGRFRAHINNIPKESRSITLKASLFEEIEQIIIPVNLDLNIGVVLRNN